EADSLDAAIDRMAAVLRTKAGDAGAPEKYHHTVTVFWMRVIARLLDKDLPLAYYSAERLASDAARLGWVQPDLQPLPWPPAWPSFRRFIAPPIASACISRHFARTACRRARRTSSRTSRPRRPRRSRTCIAASRTSGRR